MKRSVDAITCRRRSAHCDRIAQHAWHGEHNVQPLSRAVYDIDLFNARVTNHDNMPAQGTAVHASIRAS